MREREIERYFVKRVKEAGGIAYKWVSPGHPGVPDRIVLYEGCAYFVELKAPGGKIRAAQKNVQKHLSMQDFHTDVLFSKSDVDWWIQNVL